MKFADYVEKAKREYNYRVKTVTEIDDEEMASIERAVQKYNLLDITTPRKTIIQDHPLDFQDVDNAEVYIIDMVTALPVSSYVLQQELRAALNIPEKFIVVRTDNDPLEVETARQNAMREIDDEAKKKGFEKASLLSIDQNYRETEQGVDGDEFYGNGYNSRLLKYVAQVSATRKPNAVRPQSPLFDFIKDGAVEEAPDSMPEDNFNDHIEGAPKVQPWWAVDDADVDIIKGTNVSPEGNFDDDSKDYSKTYIDPKTGRSKDIKTTTTGVRKTTKKK